MAVCKDCSELTGPPSEWAVTGNDRFCLSPFAHDTLHTLAGEQRIGLLSSGEHPVLNRGTGGALEPWDVSRWRVTVVAQTVR